MAKILIVDDEPKVLKLLETLLRVDGQDPVPAKDGNDALRLLAEQSFDLMISDIHMEPMDGMELFRQAHAKWPHLPVILLTAYGAVESAQSALHNGVFDYLTKPFRVDELAKSVKRALQDSQKKAELAGLRNTATSDNPLDTLVTESDAMRRVREQIRRVAPTDASVLLTGESGTGKELMAKVMHESSRRRDKPFRAINCASMTCVALESELFGLAAESQAAANAAEHPGVFAEVQGGTLFLDEVGHISAKVQEKLLRVLKERQMSPVGSTRSVPVNVRVLSASDVNLEERVRQGLFSQDLYLRLAVIELVIPPLRERHEDILPLVQFFLRQGKKADEPSPRIPPEVANRLVQYAWPGNVQELGNAIRHALMFMSGNEITMESLPPQILASSNTANSAASGRHAFLRTFLQHNTASDGSKTSVIPPP